jgi:hypothetical protein
MQISKGGVQRYAVRSEFRFGTVNASCGLGRPSKELRPSKRIFVAVELDELVKAVERKLNYSNLGPGLSLKSCRTRLQKGCAQDRRIHLATWAAEVGER